MWWLMNLSAASVKDLSYFLPYYTKDDDEKADQSCQKKGHQVHLKETHLKEYQANFIYKVSGDQQ